MKRWLKVGLVAAALLIPVGLRAAAALNASTAAMHPDYGATKSDDPHEMRRIPAAQANRVRAAVDAVDASTSQAELIAAGKALFESNTLSKHGESCATCHPSGAVNPSTGMIIHPRSPTDFKGPRRPFSLVGVGKTGPYRWGGDIPTLQDMATSTVLGFFKDGATQPTSVTAKQVAALVAYLNSIEAPQTAFDLGTLSPAALRGQRLFEDKGQCMSCHGGPLFTDNKAHDTGVPRSPGATDSGSPVDPGAFNTPALRDLANSAPYMHNGVFTDLRQVVEFYNTTSNIAPLHLTPQEIDDMVAYLESL
jgi:cytochrome c peroxidase